jgi:hypothetical protein
VVVEWLELEASARQLLMSAVAVAAVSLLDKPEVMAPQPGALEAEAEVRVVMLQRLEPLVEDMVEVEEADRLPGLRPQEPLGAMEAEAVEKEPLHLRQLVVAAAQAVSEEEVVEDHLGQQVLLAPVVLEEEPEVLEEGEVQD